MEKERFQRLKLLIEDSKFKKLQDKRILVCGLGGVGGYSLETLTRCGITNFTIIDHDRIEMSNFNRQIIALDQDIKKLKVEVFKNRILAINPACNVVTSDTFLLPANIESLDLSSFDYIIDAIDTVSAKVALINKAKIEQIPIISAMGFGNKTDPSKIKIGDIYETSICPLARVIRRELKKLTIESLTVVYSLEKPLKVENMEQENRVVGSFMPVTASAGILMATQVIKELIET